MVAVTTVGFGDLTPTMTFIRLFASVYLIAGVSLVAAVVNQRLQRNHQALAFLARHAERHEPPPDQPNSGEDGDLG